MDSFYDAGPRKAPVPTTFNVRPTLLVPEVSLINTQPSNSNNYIPSYNNWRQTSNNNATNTSNVFTSNRTPVNNSLMKKVRFESPPSSINDNILRSTENVQQTTDKSTNNIDSGRKIQTFDQIYLANVPKRPNDLSCIADSKNSLIFDRRIEPIRKEYVKKAENQFLTDSMVTDILNYKSNSPVVPLKKKSIDNRFRLSEKENSNHNMSKVNKQTLKPNDEIRQLPKNDFPTSFSDHRRLLNDHYFDNPVKNNVKNTKNVTVETGCQTTDCCDVATNEPTVKDLLKIIAQQNEQLLQLQKQVATLLDCNKRQNNAINCQNDVKPVQQSTEMESTPMKDLKSNNNQNGNSKKAKKFAIDLMTSFQVSVRPSNNNNQAKIQEIVEEGEELDKEGSMAFGQPLKVVERCPSPEPSIQIDMNDYESSDDDDKTNNDDDDDVEGMSEIGETFYRNLMGQVNNILKKAQVQTCRDLDQGGHVSGNNVNSKSNNNRTMLKVRDATLKHLKNIGVSLPPIQDDESEFSSTLNDSSDVNASEVSFLVKQILMKYLPPDRLAHAYAAHYDKPQPGAATTTTNNNNNKDNRNGTASNNNGLIAYRPEFSFATVQYMKKYNLLAGAPPTVDKPVQSPKPTKFIRNTSSPKILDISKLKNQPKLL